MIKFYSIHGTYAGFSNFSHHPITLKNKIWKTSEHYFQAQKFAGTFLESAVRRCKGASDAARMGRDRNNPLRRDWENVKDNVMRKIVLAKFSQHEDLKKLLLSTGNEQLVEHTEKDKYWADGGNGSGKNMLGIILMEVRRALNSPAEMQKYIDKFNLESELY